MSETYKITFGRTLTHYITELILLAVLIILFCFELSANKYEYTILLTWFLVVIIFIAIPSFILHVNYHLKNKGQFVTINHTLRTISINNTEQTYQFTDIIKIEKHFCLCEQKNWKGRTMPWAHFAYMHIKFKDENYLILTSLIIDIKKTELPVIHEYRYRFFPYVEKRLPNK